MGAWVTPLTLAGSGRPAASRIVGATSMTCVNCDAQPAPVRDPVRPVHDRAVAGAAPVRGDLLRPLERRVHRPRPAHRVVVVRAGRAELVHLAAHELGRLEGGHPVEVGHLVERAVHRALGRRAVVADDQVDQRVVEDAQVLDRVDDRADVVVGVLEEARVDLHLAGEDRLEVVRHVVPGRDQRVARGELGIGRDDAQLLLAGERPLALDVPAVVEPALVLVGPFLGDVVRAHGSRRARGRRRTGDRASAPSAAGSSSPSGP